VEVTVVEADCQVQGVYSFDPKKTPEFRGMGGTSYGPALQKAKELKADLICYIGDMDAADTPENPNIPVLWVITGGTSNPPAKFGKAIRIEVGQN